MRCAKRLDLIRILEKIRKLFAKLSDNINRINLREFCMGTISQVSANNYTPAANTVKNDGDNNLYKEKLVFLPSELGLNGKRPTKIVLTEK